ncbi:Nucleotidylyl transferase [Parathielavia appendiculata]|uniref:Small ribosomal subunit protein uS10m n=1 Tax=Parathielavia appendiculata TaxID=2587402 RepID=A0AAN6TYR9_9PEZI|nr:Nucleotidylyl transferase [Parathielavia appendiculata]
MATKFGLPDEEIDRLLSEAEARLSGNGSSNTVAAVPAAKAPAVIAAPAVATAGEQTAVPAKKSEKLSVRVPQLAQKKKGPKDALEDWFNLPRTNLTPELKRDLQALRMRDVAAMGKQFFKKDSRKAFIPEYSQVGTIIAGATDGMSGRLTRKERKRTIVEEILAHDNVSKLKSKYLDIQEKNKSGKKGHAKMNPARLIRPLQPLIQGKMPPAAPRSAAAGIPRASTQLRTYASVSQPDFHPSNHQRQPPETNAAKPATAESTKPDPPRVSRMPRALEALYLKPLRREAEYGVPSCNLQLRSYSIRNLEFFCDFALRAAYYLGLPAFGPVPLPRMVERWTVPKSTFIFKKSQENFERITMRRLIQIRDGHPETVQLWLAFLQKHAYYGIGMKANVWEFSKLDVGKEMEENLEQTEKLLKDKWEHLGYMDLRPEHQKPKPRGPREQLPAAADLEEYLASERRRLFGGRAPLSNGNSKVIFSGIQPTGIPTLGNYLGALREWKRLEDSAEPDTQLFFCIVDLHAITVPRPREQLLEDRRQMLASLLAIGLTPTRSNIFFQSAVPHHAELQWILSCTASTGYLSRMTQWKAADILVYRATHVPVGEDQRQHIEFARECVTNFNHTYKTDYLVAPQTLLSPSKRIMSLTNPTQKMSKSDPSPKSRILITDSPEDIKKKIRLAVTDLNELVTYEPAERPGVTNLIEILASFDPQGRTAAQLGEQMKGHKVAELKQVVAQVLCDELAEFRDRYQHFMAHKEELQEAASQGSWVARERAKNSMSDIRRIIGLNRKMY